MPELHELLRAKHSPAQLHTQRVKLMSSVRETCGRYVMLLVGDADKPLRPPGAMLHFADIPYVDECVRSIPEGSDVDVVVHSGGGLAEAAERIAQLVAGRFSSVRYVVPMRAQSAATILVLQGDALLMDAASSLGPIDPQFVQANGRTVPAQALSEGVEKILETAKGGTLNPGYIPILQQVTPADLQAAAEASLLSKTLVTRGLAHGMFRADANAETRAEEVAERLCSHATWLSHGRMVSAEHLSEMGVPVAMLSDDACGEHYRQLGANIQVALMSNVVKLYETEAVELVTRVNVSTVGQPPAHDIGDAQVDYECPTCKKSIPLHLRFRSDVRLAAGRIPFPDSGRMKCPHCEAELEITPVREGIEGQVGKKALHWGSSKEATDGTERAQRSTADSAPARGTGPPAGNRAARRAAKRHR